MSDERQRILAMVAQGKISVQEAEKLLDTLNTTKGDPVNIQYGAPAVDVKRNVKFLRVVVESKEKDNVNVRVPMALLRAGLRLSALIPPIAYQKINEKMAEKGVEFDINQFLKSGNMEELIESMSELNVDVNSAQGDLVKVFFE
jgi:membrane peptidoglycan carboxypeptidase